MASKRKKTGLRPQRILLAEDSGVHRHLIGGYLRDWGYEVLVAKDGAEAWKLLQEPDAPALVLLDWVLPHIDGIELCRRLRKTKLHGLHTYVILLSRKDREKDLIEGIEAGADEYLMKPFKPMELKARLLAGQRILDGQQELIDARESLRMAATYDGLTKLLNRSEVLAFLEREVFRGQRENRPVGMILADVDHFKAVNDSLGHLAGDMVLKEVAARLKGQLRIYDGAGRYGGEEFLLILPGCDLPVALRRANDFRQAVSREPILASGHARHVTVSMGVNATSATMNTSATVLLSETDAALYRAKEQGRNRAEAACVGR
jgi:two-component system, cell cycle response regulator